MTDETTPVSDVGESEAAGPAFSVQRIYLKDLSFETPMGAAAFQKQWQPKVRSTSTLAQLLVLKILSLNLSKTMQKQSTAICHAIRFWQFFQVLNAARSRRYGQL